MMIKKRRRRKSSLAKSFKSIGNFFRVESFVAVVVNSPPRFYRLDWGEETSGNSESRSDHFMRDVKSSSS